MELLFLFGGIILGIFLLIVVVAFVVSITSFFVKEDKIKILKKYFRKN